MIFFLPWEQDCGSRFVQSPTFYVVVFAELVDPLHFDVINARHALVFPQPNDVLVRDCWALFHVAYVLVFLWDDAPVPSLNVLYDI